MLHYFGVKLFNDIPFWCCTIWCCTIPILHCNWTRTQNHLVHKRTLNHLAKLTKWLSCVLSIYLYGAFDCMFLSCHVRFSEWFHTPVWYCIIWCCFFHVALFRYYTVWWCTTLILHYLMLCYLMVILNASSCSNSCFFTI